MCKMNVQLDSIAAVARAAIDKLLERLNFEFSTSPRDFIVEARVKEITRDWKIEPILRPHGVIVILSTGGYRHIANLDINLVAIALYSALVIAMDDPAIFGADSCQKLPKLLCQKDKRDDAHDDTFLEHLRGVMEEMWRYYPEFGASSIMVSTLQFTNGILLQQKIKDPQVMRFLDYRRTFDGIPIPYVCFIWEKSKFPDASVYMQIIPDAVFINLSNDIMSFYKEELAGETDNYLRCRARITHKSAREVLHEVMDETIAALDQVNQILGEGAARDAWNSFVNGYMNFHLDIPRYRLRELYGGDYILDRISY